MALDPNIPLAIHPPPPVQSPTEVLGNVVKYEEIDRQRHAQREADLDQQAWQAAMRRHNGDPDRVLEELNHTRPTAGVKYSKMVLDARKEAAEALKLHLENEKSTNELIAGAARTVTDDATFQATKKWAEAHYGPEAAAILGPSYDPDRMKKINDSILSAQQYNEAQLKALEAAPKTQGEWQTHIAKILRLAKTPQQWDSTIQTAEALGAKGLRTTFGDYSDDNVQRADQFLITPEQRERLKSEDAARKALADDRIADNKFQREREERERKHQLEMERIAQEREDRLSHAGEAGVKDDPTIPNGVKSYVATLPGKYKTRAQAEQELRRALPDLHTQHPKLDDRKMYGILDAYYGRRDPDALPEDDEGPAAAPAVTASRTSRTMVLQPDGTRVPASPSASAASAPSADAQAIATMTTALKDKPAGVYASPEGTFWRKDPKGVTQTLPPPVPPPIKHALAATNKPGTYVLDVDGKEQTWQVFPNGTMMQIK